MKHLFDSWDSFSSGIISASHILFLSDLDGTLTRIFGRPQDTVLSPGIRDKLRDLAAKPAFTVGIITGRLLSEIKALVGLEGIYYAGNHGLEIEGPGLTYVNSQALADRSVMEDLARQLSDKLGDFEGVVIENKQLSLSVHYRLVEESKQKNVAEIFRQITSPWLSEGKIRVSLGKKVFEVTPPVDWHKGNAAETIMQQLKTVTSTEADTVIYMGDDTTDEDAFTVIRRPRGWSIYVGPENPSSKAEYFLNSPSEVEMFLDRLLKLK